MSEISHLIDHTNLKPDASKQDIIRLCEQSIEHNFASVCVNPINVPLAFSILSGSKPKLGTVIGFPTGALSAEMKFNESRYLINKGAVELDMVMNIAAFKHNELNIIKHEIKKVVEASNGNCVKVIIETSLLGDNEISIASNLIADSGAKYVKTSTGFYSRGANIEDVKIIKKTVGDKVGIKASGGIKSKVYALALIKAGANRIGTSNAMDIIL